MSLLATVVATSQRRHQGTTARRHTEAGHHRPQRRGAGHHHKPQPATGQRATRPDRGGHCRNAPPGNNRRQRDITTHNQNPQTAPQDSNQRSRGNRAQHTEGTEARQHRPARHCTRGAAKHSIGSKKQHEAGSTASGIAPHNREENKQTPPARQNRKQGTREQHHTERQHHKTQHRGAGHHDKPQHTTGQQATRPDRDTSDKECHQKTTADTKTQQRSPTNNRQQHTAPAGANEATKHHTARKNADNSTMHAGRTTEQHSTAPQHRAEQWATTGDQATATGPTTRAPARGGVGG